ncbi:hypothetical protein L596_025573 [Steinernema carpocapsae]|uniref:Uncharacterized protein n=1 Tax=Steinernema carpocapsae TaxID=34508 RepID=A0A4U5M847_STECR|nr:hypothetical protein L596_025573 [Steinernema carpocapsae]
MLRCCIGRSPSRHGTPLLDANMQKTEPMSVTSTANAPKANDDLVDLEVIVRNWAKQIFEVTKTKAEAKISKKHLQFNINWSHILNESLEPTYTKDGVPLEQIKEAREEQCLFRTTFTNTTDREQEYSFKTERTTRSAATAIVEKGVCRGVDMEVKLKTPCEVLEANAGFHGEINVCHIGENTTEEELTWGVDNNIRVMPHSECTAQLVILEDNAVRKFAIENRLTGKVIVTVTNLKENNSLVTIIDGNIVEIIRGMPDHGAKGFVIRDQAVWYTTKGTCKFKYGVEQRIKITETKSRLY